MLQLETQARSRTVALANPMPVVWVALEEAVIDHQHLIRLPFSPSSYKSQLRFPYVVTKSEQPHHRQARQLTDMEQEAEITPCCLPHRENQKPQKKTSPLLPSR